ncbi:hypothetical protein MiSe_49690 [Microseira wollei NIES-4236]|uniref:Uncharacterized protein n=1 Tax=Microseira wollei NIES-4236 TaxID=2530354 RepID=A0AAV3XF83_9CYAN|nr:hypothetical protein MiSe_49690 [Microseira wollei NIES-4236]
MVGLLWLSSISNYPKTGLLFHSRLKSYFIQSLYGRTDSHYNFNITQNYLFVKQEGKASYSISLSANSVLPCR